MTFEDLFDIEPQEETRPARAPGEIRLPTEDQIARARFDVQHQERDRAPDTRAGSPATSYTRRRGHMLERGAHALAIVRVNDGLTCSEIASVLDPSETWPEQDHDRRIHQVRKAMTALRVGRPTLADRVGSRGGESIWYGDDMGTVNRTKCWSCGRRLPDRNDAKPRPN